MPMSMHYVLCTHARASNMYVVSAKVAEASASDAALLSPSPGGQALHLETRGAVAGGEAGEVVAGADVGEHVAHGVEAVEAVVVDAGGPAERQQPVEGVLAHDGAPVTPEPQVPGVLAGLRLKDGEGAGGQVVAAGWTHCHECAVAICCSVGLVPIRGLARLGQGVRDHGELVGGRGATRHADSQLIDLGLGR